MRNIDLPTNHGHLNPQIRFCIQKLISLVNVGSHRRNQCQHGTARAFVDPDPPTCIKLQSNNVLIKTAASFMAKLWTWQWRWEEYMDDIYTDISQVVGFSIHSCFALSLNQTHFSGPCRGPLGLHMHIIIGLKCNGEDTTCPCFSEQRPEHSLFVLRYCDRINLSCSSLAIMSQW